MENIKVCLLYPGIYSVLLRRTFPELEMEIIRKFLEEVPRELGKYNDQKKRFQWRNGSITQFGYCDNDKDVLRYQGVELGWVGYDELTHFSEYQYTYLAETRLRSVNRKIWTRARSTSNPGGPGHGWVKGRFIDPAPPGVTWIPDPTEEQRAAGLKPMSRCFIPAGVKDGPYANDKQYLSKLMGTADPALRAALLDGNWDVFAGAAFAEWRRDKHVCRPFPIPIHWKRFWAMDWGYNAPGCILWFAVDPANGRVYVYDEFYFRLLNSKEVAKQAVEMQPLQRGSVRLADPSMWNKDPRGNQAHGECIADDFAAAGALLKKADNDRLSGKQRVHAFLSGAPDGKPWLQVFEGCTNLIRTLPTLPYDKTKVEDVDTDAEDHAYDALRYGLMSRPQPASGGSSFLAGGEPGRRHRGDDDDDDRPKGRGFYS
jgi:hypothetical protein